MGTNLFEMGLIPWTGSTEHGTHAVMDAFHRRWGLSDHMLPLTKQMRELAEHPDPKARLKELVREIHRPKGEGVNLMQLFVVGEPYIRLHAAAAMRCGIRPAAARIARSSISTMVPVMVSSSKSCFL